MPFRRNWDSTCPQIYDEWESDGAKWVIQDLPPEDDGEALKLMMEHLLPDLTLSKLSGVTKEQASKEVMKQFWGQKLSQRMSLACYHLKEEKKTLVSLNCCYVSFANEKEEIPVTFQAGLAWLNVYNSMVHIDSMLNVFKYLGTDKLLSAVGLVVRRDYRGAKLGARLLAAREPLCKSQGIRYTSTLFTGIAGQKSAARAGFTEVLSVTLRELADAGLKYPRDDRCVKVMVNEYI